MCAGLYSEAVKRLSDSRGTVDVDEYRLLEGQVEVWRSECERARIAVYEHIEEHQC